MELEVCWWIARLRRAERGAVSWQHGGKPLRLEWADEEVGRLTAVSRSRTERASRVQRAQMFWLIARIHLFLPSHIGWEFIIRRSNAASNGRWPMGR